MHSAESSSAEPSAPPESAVPEQLPAPPDPVEAEERASPPESAAPVMRAAPPELGVMGPNRTKFHTMTYEPSLEGLRGLGAIAVVVTHLSMVSWPEHLRQPVWLPGAFIFMDMFFVMSGFLISMVLLRERQRTGGIGLVRFYRRRAIRLIPALWVMLMAYVAFAVVSGAEWLGGWRVIRDSVFAAMFFHLNFKMTSIFAPVGSGLTHLWSLGLEEQFYLAWPLLVILLLPLRRSLGAVTAILVAGIGIITVMRLHMVSTGTNFMVMFTHPQSRADSFLFGGLLAFYWAHGRLPSTRVIKVAANIGVVAMTIYLFRGDQMSMFNPRIGYSLAAISFVFIMLAAMRTDWLGKTVLEWQALVILGRATYSVYIWHVPILLGVHRYGADWLSGTAGSIARTATAVVLLVSVSFLSYQYVEKPALKIRDRKASRRRPDAEAVAPAAS